MGLPFLLCGDSVSGSGWETNTHRGFLLALAHKHSTAISHCPTAATFRVRDTPQLPNVPSLIPNSRAICAIGPPALPNDTDCTLPEVLIELPFS